MAHSIRRQRTSPNCIYSRLLFTKSSHSSPDVTMLVLGPLSRSSDDDNAAIVMVPTQPLCFPLPWLKLFPSSLLLSLARSFVGSELLNRVELLRRLLGFYCGADTYITSTVNDASTPPSSHAIHRIHPPVHLVWWRSSRMPKSTAAARSSFFAMPLLLVVEGMKIRSGWPVCRSPEHKSPHGRLVS